jgi:PhzF family phenazine biosynthesis protein
MKIRQYIIDAFASRPFTGNPAAVCLLDTWLSDLLMQNIAAENNLAETAFVVKEDNTFGIRWFTPTVEVDLCGHATLASAHVIFSYTDFKLHEIAFSSRSGVLKVNKEDDLLVLDFPADDVTEAVLPDDVVKGIGGKPKEIYKGKTDYMIVYENQQAIEKLRPDFGKIVLAAARGIIVTAPGIDCDFVSRFFAPQSGINEDPVTGSAHTTLIPYWSAQLKKNTLNARQLSQRGGVLQCKMKGERVSIGGQSITFSEGLITV